MPIPTCVCAVLAEAKHAELGRLYDYARDSLGGTHLPEAVLAQTADGLWRPALCYLAPFMDERPATDGYIDRIVAPARQHGFPDWYVVRLLGLPPLSRPAQEKGSTDDG
jgi:hypothetical protein